MSGVFNRMDRDKFGFYAFKLAGVMIIVFAIQFFVSGFTDFFVLDGSVWEGQVWRFVSSVFLHGGIGHLLYNLFALVLFGSILERVIGGRKFLIVFFVTGTLANLISINFYSSSLGASGAIFGIIGALVFLRPFMMVWAFGMPLPMIVAGVAWVVGDVVGIFIPDGVGNIAHLSGMFFGLVLGALYMEKRMKKEKIVLDEESIRHWEKSNLGV